jgi:hypothetical protein
LECLEKSRLSCHDPKVLNKKRRKKMSNTINCPHCNNEIDVEEATEKVIYSTSSMYESLQGISDNTIGHVEALELPYTE